MPSAEHSRAYRAAILYFVGDPLQLGEQAWHFHEDGILWVEQGLVKAVGAAAVMLERLPRRISLECFPHHLLRLLSVVVVTTLFFGVVVNRSINKLSKLISKQFFL